MNDPTSVVMNALQQARWREIGTWLSLTDAATLAQQMAAIDVAPAKLMQVASLIEGGEPVKPPRSWNAEDKDAFAALPRGVQEVIARRETERDREIRRCQNRAAEAEKRLQELSSIPPADNKQAASGASNGKF